MKHKVKITLVSIFSIVILLISSCSLIQKTVTLYIAFVDVAHLGKTVTSIVIDGELLSAGELNEVEYTFPPFNDGGSIDVTYRDDYDDSLSTYDYSFSDQSDGEYIAFYGSSCWDYESLSEMNEALSSSGLPTFSGTGSYSDDSSTSSGGSFSIDSDSFTFTSAQKDGGGGNDWDFYFYTGTLTNMGSEGDGDYLYVDLTTPDSSTFTYNYSKSSSRDPGTWLNAVAYTGVSGGFGYSQDYNLSGGTISITQSGDEFTVSFSFTAYTGESISGNYKGMIPTL